MCKGSPYFSIYVGLLITKPGKRIEASRQNFEIYKVNKILELYLLIDFVNKIMRYLLSPLSPILNPFFSPK